MDERGAASQYLGLSVHLACSEFSLTLLMGSLGEARGHFRGSLGKCNNEDKVKHEDDLKNEDNLKNEDDPQNEDILHCLEHC